MMLLCPKHQCVIHFARVCSNLTGDLEYAAGGALSRVLRLEPIGLAALVARQLTTLFRRRTDVLLAAAAAAPAGASGAPGSSEATHAENGRGAGSWAQLLQAGQSIPGGQALVAKFAVLVSWVLPLWLTLIVVKMAVGYGVKRLVYRYNRYYDTTFKQHFKARR